jgi:stress response protein SCP2
MTKEEFINTLDNHDCGYRIESDGEIVVTGGYTGRGHGYDRVDILDLYELPSGVEFINKGHTVFNNVTDIPGGVFFRNSGDVELDSLENISGEVVFNNNEDVVLRSIKKIPSDLEFNNGGQVYLNALGIRTTGTFPFKMEGIENKRILNLMINKGIFI